MTHSTTTDGNNTARGAIFNRRKPAMSLTKTVEKFTAMVPPAERRRFRRELGKHLRATFLRANIAVGGGLAYGAGTLGEAAVDKAAGMTEGVWGLGKLHDRLVDFSRENFVEWMPEILAGSVVLLYAARNYFSHRRQHAWFRREIEDFTMDYMGRLRAETSRT